MGVCVCLQIFNSVVYVLVMWLYSTWEKFDGHIYHGYPVIYKGSPFIMYYGSALLLFTPKEHCLQTFEHRTALWAIKAVKFHIHIY